MQGPEILTRNLGGEGGPSAPSAPHTSDAPDEESIERSPRAFFVAVFEPHTKNDSFSVPRFRENCVFVTGLLLSLSTM